MPFAPLQERPRSVGALAGLLSQAAGLLYQSAGQLYQTAGLHK